MGVDIKCKSSNVVVRPTQYGVSGWISAKNYSTMSSKLKDITSINPEFITGFADAEGSFMVTK